MDLVKHWRDRVEACMDKFREGNLTDDEIYNNAHDLILAQEFLHDALICEDMDILDNPEENI